MLGHLNVKLEGTSLFIYLHFSLRVLWTNSNWQAAPTILHIFASVNYTLIIQLTTDNAMVQRLIV